LTGKDAGSLGMALVTVSPMTQAFPAERPH
jgi:hypothetical protein